MPGNELQGRMPESPPRTRPEGLMRYLDSYRFVFRNPNWVTNVLLCSVCGLIPIIGLIVLMGYCFDVIDYLLGSRHRERGKTSDAVSERIPDALPGDEDFRLPTYPDFN